MSEDTKTLTTFELAKVLRDRLTTAAAEVACYDWSPEFCKSNIKDHVERIQQADGFFRIDPNDLTAVEMDALGFGKWSEESTLRLIPLWMHPYLANEFRGGSISGEEREMLKREDIDTDHRFGCLAYGVFPKPVCDCSAQPEQTAPGEWALFHAQSCPCFDGDHPIPCDAPVEDQSEDQSGSDPV